MEAHSKSGIWTQHQDANGVREPSPLLSSVSTTDPTLYRRAVALLTFLSFAYGQRTFYFNMVHGRSFWEIPDELKAQVRQPAIDTLDDWEPAFPARGAQRREQAMQHAAANASTGSFAPGMATLHERMAQAAQRKKETEMKKFAEKQRGEDKSDAAQQARSSNEYLDMVRQLQHVDKETDSTGGKWLVR